MRKQFAAVLVLTLATVGGACGQTVAPANGAASPAATVPATPADPRLHVPLLTDWRFFKGAAPGAEAPAFADAAWQQMSIPHTWNNLDGQDGGNDYYKGEGWYRRHVTVTDAMNGKILYLRFEAINRKADIYVNGQLLGSHAGGESAICLDATKLLHPGDNLLAVKVSNRVDQDMPPLQADFTFCGGIYRPAELIAINPVHIDLSDFGSPGIYITTPRITDQAATVHVRAIVRNDGKTAANSRLILNFSTADRKNVSASQIISIDPLQPGTSREISADLLTPQPHLWNGRADPYLYYVNAIVYPNNPGTNLTDGDFVTQPLGIRTFAVDPVRGFLLNGKPYDLHGVNRHQDRQDKGWALSEADHLQDMALIKEMGCTAIRLAHYQHSQFFYDLCDKEGMIVWAEIPVVDRLGAGQPFTDNAQQQYTELIRQNFNHPSIAFWSAGNEVDEDGTNFNPSGPPVYTWFKNMSALGHKEDPSRLTASAWREKYFPPAGTTDVIGLNEYLGWYTAGTTPAGFNSGWEGLEAYIANHSDPSKGGLKGMWAMTEYGAGASIHFHSEKPVRMDHTEEYQALLHENTWKVLQQHPEIWGKFVWAMFDFASDGRAEGDHAGINDKGLVTRDRLVKKDAFYFYKAVWSQEPTLWIASKRFATRGLDKIPVKVYTNAPQAALTVNNVALGAKPSANGTIVWDNVPLQPGANSIRVSSIVGGIGTGRRPPTAPAPAPFTINDTATWTYTPGAPTEVYEAQDQPMKDALKVGPPRAK